MSQPSEPSDEMKAMLERRYGKDADMGILRAQEGNGPFPCCPSKANMEVARTLLTRVVNMLPPACSNTRREIYEFLEQLP